MVRHQSTEAGRLQGAVLAGATFLLLLIAPLAQGDPDLEDLAWPPGSATEDMPPQSQPLLFLPQQLAAVERAKRTGLSNDMRGGLGGMGGLGGTGMGGGGGMGPSLSIVNPLDVLRQRLLLEMVRRRMRQSEDQIQANREMLNSVGKRSTQHESGADLRGLLLRRHTRSIRNDEHPPRHDQQAPSPQHSPSGVGVSL